MRDDTVLDLLLELTSRLSATADEFASRAGRFAAGAPDAPATAADLRAVARRLIAERKQRRDHLPNELFHEPAWDLMLGLFLAHEHAQPMNVKALVSTSDAPATTSQRWIEHLHRLGLVDRVVDPNDRRRIELSLNDAGYAAMAGYLAALL